MQTILSAAWDVASVIVPMGVGVLVIVGIQNLVDLVTGDLE